MIGLVYGVMLVLVGVMFYLCCLYGILFTPEQARAWVLASMVSFAVDIVIQEPLVQLGKVILFFIWRLGNDSARAIVVASVAARAGVETTDLKPADGIDQSLASGVSEASDDAGSGRRRSQTRGNPARVAPSGSSAAPRQDSRSRDVVSLEDLILRERL